MSTESVVAKIRPSEQIMAEAAKLERPTPEDIDSLAKRYLAAKLAKTTADAAFSLVEVEAAQQVKLWGYVPAHAEKSRRLDGKQAVFTLTKSDSIEILQERVETLKEALAANGHADFFSKLFALRSKYELVEGAEAALKSVQLPKRLAERVLNLWGRCIDVKPKKPSLKLAITDPAKPAKKPRKTKAVR